MRGSRGSEGVSPHTTPGIELQGEEGGSGGRTRLSIERSEDRVG